MADVQIENGYTKIANDFFDALCKIVLTNYSRRVLDCIIRKTWGFNKKQDKIPLSQFSLHTGIKKSHILRSLKDLQKKNIISIARSGNDKGNTYSIIKDFDRWKILPHQAPLPHQATIVASLGNKSLPHQGPSKDNTKDNIKDNQTAPCAATIKKAPYWDTFKPETKILLKDVSQHINIYSMLSRIVTGKTGEIIELPESVVISVCSSYLKNKDSIKKAWPWLQRAIILEARQKRIEKTIATNNSRKAEPVNSITSHLLAGGRDV